MQSYLNLLFFSKLERMQNDVNQIFRQQQRKKEFISIFTSQHPLRTAYTFLPVPASAIASVIKHNSQITCITTFCLNQLTSNKKTPNFPALALSLLLQRMEGISTPTYPSIPIFQTYLHNTSSISQQKKNMKNHSWRAGKIISSLHSWQLMERRLNS